MQQQLPEATRALETMRTQLNASQSIAARTNREAPEIPAADAEKLQIKPC